MLPDAINVLMVFVVFAAVFVGLAFSAKAKR
jgi:hypothetical protein